MSNRNHYYGNQDPNKERPYQVRETPLATVYDIYISEDFVKPNQYIDLVQLLRRVGPYDIINMYINSNGGNLQTGVQLINAIQQCQGTVIGHLDGTCASLAPIVLLSCHDVLVAENSIMMFHDYSCGQMGKGSEIGKAIAAIDRQTKALLTKYATPFLSEDEIERICNGEDKWFNTEEINERLEHCLKERLTEAEEKADKAEKASTAAKKSTKAKSTKKASAKKSTKK